MRNAILTTILLVGTMCLPVTSSAKDSTSINMLYKEMQEVASSKDKYDLISKITIEKYSKTWTVTGEYFDMVSTSGDGEEDDDIMEEDQRLTEESWWRDEDGDEWYQKEVFIREEDGSLEKVSSEKHKEGTDGYVERPSE